MLMTGRFAYSISFKKIKEMVDIYASQDALLAVFMVCFIRFTTPSLSAEILSLFVA